MALIIGHFRIVLRQTFSFWNVPCSDFLTIRTGRFSRMTATAMGENICNADVVANSLPATKALEQEQRKLNLERCGKLASSEGAKLSYNLLALNFDDDLSSFPIIVWDPKDSDSDSERSLDAWSSSLTEESHALGKRGRGNSSSSRRLVRSKKIKSDLHSLAIST